MGRSPAPGRQYGKKERHVPETEHPALDGFHEPVKTWFMNAFPAPTRPQQLGWPVIRAGEHTLLLSPTGSGKTLSAFLVAIDRLIFDPIPSQQSRCRVL